MMARREPDGVLRRRRAGTAGPAVRRICIVQNNLEFGGMDGCR